ncbi:MAG: cytochrome ubiquinol oxidase subunit I [Desertimonas sp.]
MSALDLSRWQFGITTIYHFFMVPLTIGLSVLVAWFHTRWYRHGDDADLRLTKFFGKLFMINFALGVATGIVEEFQFGMNWAGYSRFVGDVFGAPLAMEGLVAFFLESTFIGLWYFGWDRLRPGVHLATIWIAALGTWASAYFIIAANSFMQHPVGVRYNAERGRAEMTSIWKILTNPTTLAAYPHVISASLLTGAVFVGAVSAWYLARHRQPTDVERRGFQRALRTGIVVTLAAGAVVLVSGDAQARMMFEQQPMKMAAAEALCETEEAAGFSVFAVGDPSKSCDVRSMVIPGLLGFLATGSFDGTVNGVNELQETYSERYGEGNYRPPIFITYWAFRGMIGFGIIGMLASLWVVWRTRRHVSLGPARWRARLSLAVIVTPFLANACGWILTEMGRQPWVVAPNPTGELEVRLLTSEAVSVNVGAASVWVSMIGFTVLYGALAVVELFLLLRYIGRGLDDDLVAPPPTDDGGTAALVY